MNKIYKVIWSKVKHQYVVTSEFAHSCTKSTTSRVGKGALAALAAFVLTAGVGGVQAAGSAAPADLESAGVVAGTILNSSQAEEDKHNLSLGKDAWIGGATAANNIAINGWIGSDRSHSIAIDGTIHGSKSMAIGEGSHIWSNADESMALGYWAQVGENATNAVALGVESKTLSKDSVVVGSGANVDEDADGSIAIGKGAAVESSYFNSAKDGSTGAVALGSNAHAKNRNTTAIGSGAIAGGDKSTALGNNARTAKESVESVSFGYWAQANADNSVALGSRSVADEANTVSVGNSAKGLTRKITNVKDGENLTDAVNVKQLNTKTANMVEWDPILDDEGNPTGAYTKNTIHGVILDNGTISAANGGAIGGIHVDAAGTMWDLKNDGNYGLMYSEGNLELSGALTAANGAVKIYDNGIVQAGDKILLNSSMGQVIADSVGANDVTTQSFTAGNGKVKVDKDGKLSTTGEVLMQNGKGESLAMTDGGLSLMSTDNGTGMVTVANGEVNLMGGGNTTVTVDGNGTTFGTLTGDAKTTISGGSITGLTNQKWNGATDDESRAATEGQLADLSETVAANAKGVVKWDDGTNDTIHGVQLAGDGAISAASDRFSVDRYGNIAAQTYGGEGDNTNYYFNMNHADGISMGYSNGASINVDPNGVHFKVGEQETFINGNTMVTGRVNADTVQADTVQADAMYVGTQTPGNAVVTQDQLTGGISTATQGVVKWDPELDENGKPIEGKYTDSIHGVGLQEGGKITGTSLVTNSTIGSVKIENGAVTTTGNAQSSIGGVKFQSGEVTAEKATVNTRLQVGASSNPNETTRIQGGTIHTGSVIGLTNTEWTGTTDNESRAATEGQLADLNATVSENAEGVVKWDKDANGDYQEGTIHGVTLQDGSITAANGNFSVDELGNVTATVADTNNSFSLTENGVSMKADNTTLDVTSGGVAIGNGADFTYINGNEINTGTVLAGEMYVGTKAEGNAVVTKDQLAGTVGEATEGVVRWDKTTNDKGETIYQEGQLTVDNLNTTTLRAGNGHFYVADDGSFAITNGDNLPTFSVGNDGSMNAAGGKFQVSNTGEVVAQDMYVGSKSETNAVVTKGELDSAVSDMTNNSVQWDDPQTKDSINGVGLKDGNVTADTINVGDGALVVDKSGNTTVGGDLNVEGDLKVNGDYVATAGQINDIKTDVSGIKTEIGVDENGNYKTIDNGAGDVITGINNNTSSINGIKDQIGATGENGALNLSNGATTIEGGINQNTTAIQQNSQAINSLGHRVSDLGDEIDSVGAISAALAGLHPLDYDGTGSKFQISAAMGTYDGTQAAAIGGFYHFNRDVMMSLGGATSFEGDKKTAANIGVTFRVGEGASGKTVSNDILARLEAMDQKIAALEQENKELKNVLGAIDTSLSKEFPDVPANHWAYEAVTKLAGNDVVDGYPDGEFHGDRTMTRYEMAEIIYKAMNRGAKVDQKLVEEFKPEMEQVAANETTQAQSTPAQEAPAQDAQ